MNTTAHKTSNKTSNKNRVSTQMKRRRARALIGLSLIVVIGAGFSAVSSASNVQSNKKDFKNNYIQITVADGQSLWSIASAINPNKAGELVGIISDLNSLQSPSVVAGEKIWVPVKA